MSASSKKSNRSDDVLYNIFHLRVCERVQILISRIRLKYLRLGKNLLSMCILTERYNKASIFVQEILHSKLTELPTALTSNRNSQT